MIRGLLHRLLMHRHFWRQATFSEIAELYASRMMRIFALRLVSVFASVYLLQSGYTLLFITLFWVAFYGMRILFSWPSALLIARLGPKHATFISNIVSAIGMALLPLTSQSPYGLLFLIVWCTLHAYSGAMNDIAYLVDFSKVKNNSHAGKELGFMNLVEKIATGLSPFIGGAIAYMFGPYSIMVLSAVLFVLSAIPLLATAEPTQTRIPINFIDFPWRTTWRSLVAQAGVGVDLFTTASGWTIFLTLVVFGLHGNRIYAEIGFVTSVTLLVSIVISYTFGRMIDRQQGNVLLQWSTLINSSIHLLRALITTPIGVIAINTANEVSTTGYNMPFLRGMFDTADYSGRRIEYLFLSEVFLNLGAALAALLLAVLVAILDNNTAALQFSFVVGGLLTLLIATPRFRLYKK